MTKFIAEDKMNAVIHY
ncbi:Protein of unknown function [Bacillus cereus]|nr:Protein of unknown function [Bacillus cereus]